MLVLLRPRQLFAQGDKIKIHLVREAIKKKKSRFYGHFPYGGGLNPIL